MDYDADKVDEMVLALLWLTMFPDAGVMRAWKGHDWDALGRLHTAGYIADPRSKAKSLLVTDKGVKRARELFARHFGVRTDTISLESEQVAEKSEEPGLDR